MSQQLPDLLGSRPEVKGVEEVCEDPVDITFRESAS